MNKEILTCLLTYLWQCTLCWVSYLATPIWRWQVAAIDHLILVPQGHQPGCQTEKTN